MVLALVNTSHHFPANWYHPTSASVLMGMVVAMVQIFNMYLIFAPIALVFAIAAAFKRPEKFLNRLAVLLLPIMPALLATLWGAYCWHYYPKSLATFNSSAWTYDVFDDLSHLYFLHFIVLGLVVTFARRWQNARIFGWCILVAEFLLTAGTVFVAGMATSGSWL